MGEILILNIVKMKLIVVLIFLCSLLPASASSGKYLSKPIELVNSIIARYDSLVNFMDKKESWQYDYALLAGAIGKLTEYTGDSAYFNYMKEYVDYYVNADGSVKYYNPLEYNLDKIRPGVNLFYLFQKTKQKKYSIAIENEIGQLKTHPRTSDGGYWHKKIYPSQMWLDGIFMASPFMVQYANMKNEPLWYDEAVKQITQIYSHTVDKTTGLLYHGWDESKQEKWSNPVTGNSIQFWSRSVGWYAMAIVDVLDYLPKNHPGRTELLKILNDLSAALLKVQDAKTGLWWQVLDKAGKEKNYLEASGSSMFAYAFAKGSRLGYLPKSYLKSADKAFNGISSILIKKDTDGFYSLVQSCGGCGLGGKPYRDGSYDYYVNEKITVNDPKGLAPYILAGIELNEAHKK